jgi:hypothetical protein
MAMANSFFLDGRDGCHHFCIISSMTFAVRALAHVRGAYGTSASRQSATIRVTSCRAEF